MAAVTCTLIIAGFSILTKPPMVINDTPSPLQPEAGSIDNIEGKNDLQSDHSIADDFGFQLHRPEPENDIIIIENPHEKYPIGKNNPDMPEIGKIEIELLPDNNITCPHCGTVKYIDKAKWNGKTTGHCQFQLLVGTDGIPRRIIELNCSNSYIESIVRESLPKWKYHTKFENGEPVEFTTSSKLSFRLTDEDGNIIAE